MNQYVNKETLEENNLRFLLKYVFSKSCGTTYFTHNTIAKKKYNF